MSAETYRKVKDSSLAAVAAAIQQKGGTSEPLVFPAGFVAAIGEIRTEIPSNYGKITYNGSRLKVE